MRIFQKTERRVLRDELTGLYNYRHLRESLPVELERAHKCGSSLSLIMIDIDDFKKINDTHGHLTGDGILVQIADVLLEEIPSGGTGFRYGGEEFVILLPNYTKKFTHTFADELRKRIAENRFININMSGSSEEMLKLTISLGITSYPSDSEDEKELLDQADNALYEAKAMGKNKVALFSGNLRRHKRYAVDLEGEFARFPAPSARMKVIDLSLSGIGFEAAEPINHGAIIDVHIPIDAQRHDVMNFLCRIVYVKQEDDRHVIGGEILEIDNPNKAKLFSLLHAHKG
jgi:diguanylate cyclase (GGDEF)-like protein